MRVYITDLEAYNRGHLVGEWISLPMNDDLLAESIENILQEGKRVCKNSHFHEEVFITEYESILYIKEYDDISKLNQFAEKLESYTKHDILKFRILSCEGYSEREVINNGIDSYDIEIYDFSDTNKSFRDSFELLAIKFVNDGLYGDIPKHLENYLDYAKMASELRKDYTLFANSVFRIISK